MASKYQKLVNSLGIGSLQKISASPFRPSYGSRNNGSRKGTGYLGELKRPDGRVSTELSIGVRMDGKDIEIPSLVPTLSDKEINYLLAGNEPTQEIIDKAVAHAKERILNGEDPYAN
jgi:hypothetical protein